MNAKPTTAAPAVSGPAAETAEKATPKARKKNEGKKAVADSGSFCVYLGPSILGVIQRGTIYNGSKAATIASLSRVIEKYPLVKDLIVSDKTLAEDRIRVKTPGNLLYVNYHTLASGKK